MLAALHSTWLENRHLDLEIVTRYGVHTDYSKTSGRGLAFPYVRQGAVIKNKIRLPHKQFIFDRKDAPHAFWNEDCLRDGTLNGEPLIITEGETDALAAIQSGFMRVVSVDGGANSNLDFIAADLGPLMTDVPAVVLAVDGDAPGKGLAAELARRLNPARCRWLEYPKETKDLNDVLIIGREDGVRSVLGNAHEYPIKGLYRFSDYPDEELPELYNTGFTSLNAHLKLWTGEFMVITGIPSHGKSRFALSLAGQLALEYNHRTAMATFEMAIKPYVRDVLREHHAARWVRELSPQQRTAADEWMQAQFHLIDARPRDVEDDPSHEWIIARAEDAVIKYGVKWLLVDPWNQVEHKRRKFETTPEYQSRAIKDFKRFSQTFGCGVWIVTHPTKDVREKDGSVRKPSLYDIDGSAHWFNAADHGVIVWRNKDSNLREIDVQKSRYWTAGKPGSGYLRMDHGRLVSAANNEGKKSESETVES